MGWCIETTLQRIVEILNIKRKKKTIKHKQKIHKNRFQEKRIKNTENNNWRSDVNEYIVCIDKTGKWI